MMGHYCERCDSDEHVWREPDGRWLCDECAEEENYNRRRPCPDIEDLDERCES
jgi:ribosomal protein L37AE/L43A